MKAHEEPVRHDSAQRYEASRTLATKYTKEVYLMPEAWQWGVWFFFNGQQCGTPCPYWPEECYVGSDVCVECPGCEGIQIVTGHSGRVFCKNKREQVRLLPDMYFLPEGEQRGELPRELPDELCPW